MQPSGNRRVSKAAKGLTEYDIELAREVGGFYDDPLGYVLFALPWGKKGTRLADEDGPDTWQREVLTDIGKAVRENGDRAMLPIMYAVASGHGIGKTALIAWIIMWFLSTREFPQVVVTAGKKEQLMGKTWRELAKWQKLAINGHHFIWSATKIEHVLYPDQWNAQAIAWSKSAPENFAGTHEKHVLVVFDEASAIDDLIWEVTDGAMTTPGAMWIAFGNPTKAIGRFAQCFGKFKHRWRTRAIDSRTAKMANRALLDQWVEDYGEDHDFVRVRVRGLFPRAGDLQFISIEDVAAAVKRECEGYEDFARILGVDVARHGDDQSVFCRRQGRKTFPFQRFRIKDTMALAARVAEEIDEWKPDFTFIDATGMGWGVYDRLKQMGYKNVIAVQVGEKALDPARFVNRRAELWHHMREYIQDGGQLPVDPELEADLINPEYGFDANQRYALESKKDLKKRNLPSPDSADSLALTFTAPIAAPKRDNQPKWRKRLKARRAASPMAA